LTFARTDEQRMLAEALDSALAQAGREADWAAAVTATGVDALGVAEDAGGLGTDPRDAAVVAAAFGRANVELPWAEHWVAARLGATGEAPLSLAPMAETQDWAADAVTLLHCAELVGLCRAMLRASALFAKERKQFGVAIASFQALRHRMADMAMMLEQAEAITGAALDALDGDAEGRARAVSAARVTCDDAAKIVGEGAVQIHGAMGLTAEMSVGGYFRRARALAQRDGTARQHLRRYAA
jgi:alkylation response protein AidB-like acyl-CoA dehydrogenase